VGNHIKTFNIKTKNGQSDHHAIDSIVERFFQTCEPYLEKVDGKSICVIYVEDSVSTLTGKGGTRAEVIGIIKWNLREDGHKVWGVTSAAINSFIQSKFNVKFASRKSKDVKEGTMRALHRHCKFWTTDDNEADAYAIALYGYAHAVEKQRLSPRAHSRMI
jgi:hypothetical protein